MKGEPVEARDLLFDAFSMNKADFAYPVVELLQQQIFTSREKPTKETLTVFLIGSFAVTVPANYMNHQYVLTA